MLLLPPDWKRAGDAAYAARHARHARTVAVVRQARGLTCQVAGQARVGAHTGPRERCAVAIKRQSPQVDGVGAAALTCRIVISACPHPPAPSNL
jgi:hypothetical protein